MPIFCHISAKHCEISIKLGVIWLKIGEIWHNSSSQNIPEGVRISHKTWLGELSQISPIFSQISPIFSQISQCFAQMWQKMGIICPKILAGTVFFSISKDLQPIFSALLKLVNKVVPYDMMHNSETDAADLLMEIERLDLLVEAVDTKSYKKVSLYLKSCVPYAPDPENTTLMKTALEIYLKFDKYCEAMFVALQLNEDELIEDIFLKCTDLSTRKQLSYILGRQQAHRVFTFDDF